MHENLRISGIDIIGDVPWGMHFCQFYKAKEDLMDIMVPYFKAGLENNELCVWIISRPIEVEEAKEAMKRVVPDIDIYLEEGQMEIIPYTHGYIKEGIFDPERAVNSWVEKINQVLVKGYDGLRATGDTRWLEKKVWNDFVDYEKKVDAIINKHHVIALCPYYLEMCSTAEIIDIVSNHQFALIRREGKWERIDNSGRKRSEEALRLSNLYNRSLIEANLDPLVTIGPEGKITDVNEATELVTGYSRKELIGTDFSDYFTEPEKAHKGYQQVFEAGEVRDYPLEIQHRDGHKTPVLYHASVYKDEIGKVIGVFAAARDITERKKSEEALKKAYENLENLIKERTVELEKAYNSLKESEEGLAEAQRIAHIGNWDWNIVTGEGYWSNELYNIFGRGPQKSAPSYTELLSYIHPEDRDYVEESIKKGLEKEPKSGIDFRIVLANGEERTVHSQAEVIFDEQNNPVRVKGIAQDVTEHKKTEEKIQILANAVESSSDAIVTFSLEGIILSWNKGAEQIYGHSAEEVLGKNISILEPDDLKVETKRFSEKIKQGEKSQCYESLRVKKDCTKINISVIISPVFNTAGEFVAILAIGRDITEHKREEKALRESEARLRRFYESGMFGVIYYNIDGSIIEANDKFLEIVGYSREDLRAGRINWKKMTPPEYRLLDEYAVAELKVTGGNVIREKEYVRKDGSHVPIIFGAATFDYEGQEGIAFVIDNTERKKAEDALAKIEDARKKEIHHRIKNNLQVISSLLDLQAEKFRDKEVLEAFRESQNRVRSMSLIHEELYKGEGTDTLNFSIYIQELANKLFQTYSLKSKKINLLMNLEDNAFFDMDTAVPLGIIVNELVSNSLKHAFTEDKEGEIRIKLCREGTNDKTGKSLFSLTISDNGKGISENVELERTEPLGLELVNTLVDQLDGNIELKRVQGTEFRITFYVAEKS
jgi:PAS domain S-box-containing protein